MIDAALLVIAVGLALALRNWLFADLGAERRGRRAACAALAEIAAQHPEAAPTALAALTVASLPGDPSPAELRRGPG